MVELGSKAPDFNLLDQNGERVELGKALKKGKTLLVFYPGNDTPVCTAQLCDYRDHHEAFTQLGIQIYGITVDTIEGQHAKSFAEKHHFPFPLLNDYDGRVARFYGAMSFMGMPKRALFLIDESQHILYKHVEFLPIFRRSSEALLKDLQAALQRSVRKVS